MKKILWIPIIALIVIGLISVRLKRVHEKNSAPLVKDISVAVYVAPVKFGTVAHTRHVMGTVTGSDEADIAPRVMASVQEVLVREGDSVEKGQLLATLDPREIKDGVTQAEAGVAAAREGLAAAQSMYDTQRDATARDRKLFEADAISQEQWDHSRAMEAAAAARLEAARAQLKVARKRLDQARVRLDYTRLTAPFDGVISHRFADPGDLGIPGHPVCTIVRRQGIRIRAQLPSEDFTLLKKGLPVSFSMNDVTIQSVITRVFPAMGKSHLASFESYLESPPPGFVSGTTVGVDVTLTSTKGLSVPIDAILEGEQSTWVFKVVDKKVHSVQVKILDRSSDSAVISGDIHENDRVIVARSSRLMTLSNGMHVNPIPWEEPNHELR